MKPLCISADSHVVEPPEVFAGLTERFGDRAPRIVESQEGAHVSMGNGQVGMAVGAMLTAGIPWGTPAQREATLRGYEARPGGHDVNERLKDQDKDGVDAEVLYPSLLFGNFRKADVEVAQATFINYNDWLANYCKGGQGRLFGLGCAQMYDIDLAIQEMERCKALGHVGVCLPCSAPTTAPYCDAMYDKFWAAAQEMDMPVAFHTGTGTGSTNILGSDRGNLGRSLALVQIAVTIHDLIMFGACERFPKLKFLCTEFETGWLAHFLMRMDEITRRSGGRGGRNNTVRLQNAPSFYWHQNWLATFEDDPLGIRTRDIIGVDNMMWGSDYPHGDSVWPESQRVLSEIFSDCTPEERHRMVAKNVVEVHHLPFEA